MDFLDEVVSDMVSEADAEAGVETSAESPEEAPSEESPSPESEESVESESEQPEQAPSKDDGQPSEEGSGEEPEQPTDGPEPEQAEQPLLAGKFKSVEDLERSYREAQPLITRAQQEAAGLRREVENLRAENQRLFAQQAPVPYHNLPPEQQVEWERLSEQYGHSQTPEQLYTNEAERHRRQAIADHQNRDAARHQSRQSAINSVKEFVNQPDFLEHQNFIGGELAKLGSAENLFAEVPDLAADFVKSHIGTLKDLAAEKVQAARWKAEADSAYKRGYEEGRTATRAKEGAATVASGSGSSGRSDPNAKKKERSIFDEVLSDKGIELGF